MVGSACNAGDSGLIPGTREDPLEKGMATHSGILVWRVPQTEEPGGWVYSPWGHKESDTAELLTLLLCLNSCKPLRRVPGTH